jgi:hypothetical protein
MKAVGYYRSGSAQPSEDALIRQYAHRQGLVLEAIHSDEPMKREIATKAEVRWTRSGIIGMLDAIDAGSFDCLVVTDPDHLERTDIFANALREIEARDVRIVTVGEELRLKGSEQNHPSPVSLRLFYGRCAGARAGKHQSGPAPYGYMRDYSNRKTNGPRLQIHPEEASVVQTIFKEYLRRRSMKRLIEFLDAQGLRTRRRKQWSRAGVSWILKNETYLGRVHFGNIRARGQHPAIISPIIFNKAQKLIAKNKKRGVNKNSKENDDDDR